MGAKVAAHYDRPHGMATELGAFQRFTARLVYGIWGHS